MSIQLAKHQLKAIEELRNGTILNGGVGTGKSRTALAYFYQKVCGGSLRINGEGDFGVVPNPRDIYIITTAKKRDQFEWEAEAAPFGISRERSNSVDGIQLKVDSWNNIANYVDVKNAFFILDEQRLVGLGAWGKAFLKIAKHNQWIMLSATPGDAWMDYLPVFMANGFYRTKTEFTDNHVIWKRFSKFPQIERYYNTDILHHYRDRLIVDMPLERHTVRHIQNLIVSYDKEKFDKVVKERWHIYEDRPIKDVGELFRVMRKLVNSDSSRVAAVLDVLKKHKKLIIFYNFNYELEALRTVGPYLGIPSAEWNGHKHEEIPEGDSWIYLVQYTSGAEGWNCVDTDGMVFYSLNYSYKIFEQAQGRIDRFNTPFTNLYYYVLKSPSAIDGMILKSLKNKENFNERSIKW